MTVLLGSAFLLSLVTQPVVSIMERMAQVPTLKLVTSPGCPTPALRLKRRRKTVPFLAGTSGTVEALLDLTVEVRVCASCTTEGEAQSRCCTDRSGPKLEGVGLSVMARVSSATLMAMTARISASALLEVL